MGQAADQWWFWRGFLSAIFYYSSCGPCYAMAYKRKRRQEAQRDRKHREAVQMEQPGRYQHPAPFEINPFWHEEISLGPGPPPRRARNRTANSSNTEKSLKTDGKRALNTASTQSTMGSRSSSATDLGPVQDPSHLLGGHGWNKKRYHRPDEELLEYISEQVDSREGPTQQGIGMGSSDEVSRLAVTKPAPAYYSARAPPVNDLHPPVVSTPPSSWRDRKWMKAKPPSAAFMEGKKGVTNLTRSRSGLTNPSTDLGPEALQKQIQPTDGCTPDQISASLNRLQLPARQFERGDSSTSITKSQQLRKKRRPPPLHISQSSNDETDSNDDEMPVPATSTKRKPFRRVSYISRRKFSGRAQGEGISDSNIDENYSPATSPSMASPTLTVHSDRDVITPSSLSSRFQPTTSKMNQPSPSHPHPTPKKSYDSLNALQDLVDSQTLLNSKFAKGPSVKARVPLRKSDNDSKENLSGGRANADIEALWLDEKDVARWGQNRRWSIGF